MSEKKKLNWSLSVAISGGPAFSISDALAVDAYDVVEVPIDAGATDQEVELQPGGANKVEFLLVTAGSFAPSLTYATAAGGTAITLDAPHVWIGQGALALLTSVPNSLFFTNSSGDPVTAKILVGRNALVTP